MKLPQQMERVYGDGLGRVTTIKISSMNDKESVQKRYTRGLSTHGLLERCKKANEINDKYTVRESKWSGKVISDDDKCRKEKISGRKLWSCDILLSRNCQDRTIIHEDLHARSGSYMNPISYIPYGKMEEASVEFLAREICKAEKIPFSPNKNKNVNALYEINRIANICDSDLDFAQALFAKDLKRRHEWLKRKTDNFVKNNQEYTEELEKLLGSLKGSKL